MNIIEQLDATVTRGNLPKRFWEVRCRRLRDAITTLTLSLHGEYNKYTKLKTLFIHEGTLGRLILMRGEGAAGACKRAVGTIENISLLILDSISLSLYLVSPFLPSQIFPRTTSQPLQRLAERQDALVLKASARAVSPALRMECVDNVDESGWQERGWGEIGLFRRNTIGKGLGRSSESDGRVAWLAGNILRWCPDTP